MKYAFLLLNLILGFTVKSATYYISTSGNDANTSTQAQSETTPWKTITRLNQHVFVAGDVVLFKRGQTFRGEVVAISGVSYGAYGTGNAPIISGAVTITGWTRHKDNIYVANANSPIKKLIVNNKTMTLARFPNTGFLYFDKGVSPTNFTDAEITQPSGYWNGANVRLSIKHWNNAVGKVTSHEGGSITYSPASSITVLDGYTYYFENKFEELDVEKEWFYDATAKKVYLYAPGGIDPSTLKVEGIVLNYGFKSGKNTNNVTIRDLQIEKQEIDGIYLYNGAGGNNTIINNKFIHQTQNGICFMGDNTRIEGNTFTDIDGRAIVGNVSKNSTCLNNTFRRIGMRIGYGVSTNTSYKFTGGIILGAATSNFKIAFNKMDSIGYIAIRPDGSFHTVERNIIKYTMLTHADGAAIYAWGDVTHNVTIKDNFIYHTKGFALGKPGHLAYGIYLDVNAHHCSILNNTIIDSDYGGILLNGGNHNTVVSNNVCYGTKLSSIKLDDWLLDAPVANNTVTKNVLFSTIHSSVPLHVNSKYDRYDFGRADSNFYINPYSEILVKRNNYASLPVYSLTQWRTLSGQDLNTKRSPVKWQPCETVKVTGTNLITNGNFAVDKKGWGFSNKINSISEYVTSGIDGGSITYSMFADSPKNGFIISPVFAGVKDQNYELKFSVKSTKSGTITAIIREAHSPYAKLYSRNFPIDPTRANYSHVFKMPNTDPLLRVDFEIQYDTRNFTMDNVSLTPVSVVCHEPKDRSAVFTNPTNSTVSVDLAGKTYRALNGSLITGKIVLQPWSSRVLILDPAVNPQQTELLRTPENPSDVVNGVKYAYYQGNWAQLPTFNKLTPLKEGITEDFNISLRSREDYFGFTYEAYVNVPTDGQYTFYTTSDDGSRLYIGSTLVVDNDGRHAATEKSGTIGLKAGKHLIRVEYFENANGNSLTAAYSGPGIAKKEIPASELFYEKSLNTNARIALPEEEQIERLQMYPNPANNFVTLSSANGNISKVNFINSYGKISLRNGEVNASEHRIDVRGLATGVYLLEITYLTGEKELKRIVITE